MRVDTHIHIFPDACHRNPKAFADAQGEPHWLNLVAPAGRPSIQGWADPDTCLRDMDAAGIDLAILQGWYWENPYTCEIHNRLYADIIERWPDRFRAFACFHPDLAAKDNDWVQKIVDTQFCGIGELLPQAQHYTWDDPVFEDTLEQASALGLWVNFHVTEPVGGDYPGRIDTPLQEFVSLAKEHPKLRIILSHLGGGLAFYAKNPSIRKHLANVYFDTAAWPLIYAPKAASVALKLIGESSALYGTDYPLRTFPKKPREAQMQYNLDAFMNLPDMPQGFLEFVLKKGSHILPSPKLS